MINYLQDNQIAAGMLASALIVGALAYARNLPGVVWQWFWRTFFVYAEIKNTSPVFHWLTAWLDNHPYTLKAKNVSINTASEITTSRPSEVDEAGENKFRILVSPGPGHHVLFHKGALMWLSRTGEKGEVGPRHLEREHYGLWVFGRSQRRLRCLLQDIIDSATSEDRKTVGTYTSHRGGWYEVSRRPRGEVPGIVFDDGKLQWLITDARQFLSRRAWYRSLGIPFRRGYLLEGVHGSGKTSSVIAVAATLGMDVYALSLGAEAMDDEVLTNLLLFAPSNSIILFEDIDTVVPPREAKSRGKGKPRGVTLSGLLNVLDGAVAAEGRILFMTTNRVAELDSALIRPGRADVHLTFGCATPRQAGMLFEKFFPDRKDLVEAFERVLVGKQLTMAEVQKFLVSNHSNPAAAVENWPAAVEQVCLARATSAPAEVGQDAK